MPKAKQVLITDDELALHFQERLGKRRYRATFIPEHLTYAERMVSDWDNRYFTADSKPEAVRIAREYGARIINKKMIYVYLATE